MGLGERVSFNPAPDGFLGDRVRAVIAQIEFPGHKGC